MAIVLHKITGTDLDDTLHGSDGKDEIYGGKGNDELHGGKQDDNLFDGDGDDRVFGEDGDDHLYGGGAGNDYFDGGAGNDSLSTFSTNNEHQITMVGGAGNDNLNAYGSGASLLYGGEGNDSLTTANNFTASLFGGEGDDTYDLNYGGGAISDSGGYDKVFTRVSFTNDENSGIEEINGLGVDVILVGNSSDNLIKAARSATMLGMDGNDTLGDAASGGYPLSAQWLDGGNGDDLILGNDAGSTLVGGAGNDTLLGGTSNDFYVVTDNLDSISDRGGIDTVVSDIPLLNLQPGIENAIASSASGDSLSVVGNALANFITVGTWTAFSAIEASTDNGKLFGGGSSDFLQGSLGNDLLEGGSGGDVLMGDAGNDTLAGGTGHDLLFGGLGDDTFRLGDIRAPGSMDAVFDDGGNDTIRVVNVDFVLQEGIENLIVSTFVAKANPFELRGNSAANEITVIESTRPTEFIIEGMGGNDTLNGSAYYDVLDGGDGDDVLLGMAGDDYLLGGHGNNTFFGGQGNDEIYVAGGGSNLIFGGVGNDRIYAPDGSTIHGGFGNDIVNPSIDYDGSIVVFGDGGDDTIFGTTGSDTLVGGLGADDLAGGKGDDTYMVDQQDIVLDEVAAGGNDTVISNASWTLDDYLETLVLTDLARNGHGNELDNMLQGNGEKNHLFGDSGNDTLKGMGNDDVLHGESGNDVLNGGAGKDYVYGDEGNDTLNGMGGDFLLGGAGDDVLNSGTGFNFLIGGDGADYFVFEMPATKTYAVSHVQDFQIGEDKLMLDSGALGFGYTGTLAEENFRLGAVAQDADDRILFQSNTSLYTGTLYYDADGNGGGFSAVKFGMVILFPDTATLTSADFLVV